MSFALGAKNLLTGPDVDPSNFGSTFWTSPQSDWKWPPVPEIDHQPYTVVEGDEALVCCGSASAQLGLLVTKRFRVVPFNQAMVVEYEICNQRAEAVRVAPWEISRVRGGLTVFMQGERRTEPPPGPQLSLLEKDGACWFAYDRASVVEDSKVFAHSGEGWMAHFDDRVLLLKEFELVNPQKQAPGEAMIEIFASGLNNYIEIEQQGAYSKIGPWKSSRWSVSWKARQVPDGLSVVAGNPELTNWIRTQLG